MKLYQVILIVCMFAVIVYGDSYTFGNKGQFIYSGIEPDIRENSFLRFDGNDECELDTKYTFPGEFLIDITARFDNISGDRIALISDTADDRLLIDADNNTHYIEVADGLGKLFDFPIANNSIWTRIVIQRKPNDDTEVYIGGHPANLDKNFPGASSWRCIGSLNCIAAYMVGDIYNISFSNISSFSTYRAKREGSPSGLNETEIGEVIKVRFNSSGGAFGWYLNQTWILHPNNFSKKRQLADVPKTGSTYYQAYVTRNDTFFISYNNDKEIYASFDQGVSWAGVLNLSETNSVMWQTMTEDDRGGYYIGEYNDGDEGINASNIYKSSDGGHTWTVVYNDTAEDPDTPGRHVHFVGFDNYTKNIYASIGDFVERRKLIRSSDYGATWQIINRGSANGISWQFTGFAATPNYRFFAEDWDSSGKHANSSIYRTSDDVNFERIYTTGPGEIGAWYWAKVLDDNIYFASSQMDGKNESVIVMTPDEGNNFYHVAYRNDTYGYSNPSNLDPTINRLVVTRGNLGLISELRPIDLSGYAIHTYKINENGGNDLIDSTGGGANFSFTEPTWNRTTYGVNITPCAYNSYCNSSNPYCRKDISAGVFEYIPPYNSSVFMCRAASNDPYTIYRALSLKSYVTTYGNNFNIDCEGTGLHKSGNLADISGSIYVYKNNQFVTEIRTDEHTASGCDYSYRPYSGVNLANTTGTERTLLFIMIFIVALAAIYSVLTQSGYGIMITIIGAIVALALLQSLF